MSAGADGEVFNGAAVVVFGLDEAGKPHASAFEAGNARLAKNAAALMGMRVLRPNTEEQRAVAAKLPKGRVFASGKAFVPFVAKPLYESLAAFSGVQVGVPPGKPKKGCTGSPGAPKGNSQGGEGQPPHLPATLVDIGPGSIVLATEGPEEGWFEAVVVTVEGEMLKLRWRDYPGTAAFSKRLTQVALLPPDGDRA